jgi:hypothetical protein
MYGDGHCGHAHLQPLIPTVVIDRAETEAAGTQEEEECHFKKRDAYSISDTCNPQPIGGLVGYMLHVAGEGEGGDSGRKRGLAIPFGGGREVKGRVCCCTK